MADSNTEARKKARKLRTGETLIIQVKSGEWGASKMKELPDNSGIGLKLKEGLGKG
jgi:hypothetical protein